jgi:hypothetical protein
LRGEEAAKGFKKRGLSGPIGTDHADELTSFDLERDVLKDPVLAITERNGTQINQSVFTTFLFLRR